MDFLDNAIDSLLKSPNGSLFLAVVLVVVRLVYSVWTERRAHKKRQRKGAALHPHP